MKQTIDKIETEPIFGIHIDFANGSNPIVYYNLSLARTLDVLKEWSEEWILSPDNKCKLISTVWYWHARERSREKPSNNKTEDYADLLAPFPDSEFTEPTE